MSVIPAEDHVPSRRVAWHDMPVRTTQMREVAIAKHQKRTRKICCACENAQL